MKTLSIQSNNENISTALDFVEKNLKEYKVKQKSITRAMLLTEETIAGIINTCDDINDISISTKKVCSSVSVTIRAKGSEFHFDNSFSEFGDDLDLDSLDDDSRYAINKLILKSYENRISTKYRNGINTVTITPKKVEQSNLIKCGIAILLAIITGILFRLLAPENVNTFLCTKVLGSITTVFMNALKMITGPLIFFSLSACVASFTDLKLLGKIGGRVIMFYLFTTLVAITVGIGIFNIFHIVDKNSMVSMVSSFEIVKGESVSILDTFLNIVPSNFFAAFVNSDTLQILFMALLIGIAATKLGNKSQKVADFFDCANELFLKVASIITKGLPLLIFSSITSLILSTDVSNIDTIGTIILSCICGSLIMLTLYALLVLIIGKKNPFTYIKKIFPAWLNAFTLSSSNASMPTTMQICDKELNISKKVYSFSIPLGATINMDGLTVILTLLTQALAAGFGITFSISEYIALIVSIVLLSMATPGIPGSGIAMLSLIAGQFGIPVEGVALVSSIMILLDPLETSCNVCGDIAGTYIIASRSGLLTNKKSDSSEKKS